MIPAKETADVQDAGQPAGSWIAELLLTNQADKVNRMIDIFRQTGVDQAAQEAKKKYMVKAYGHLDKISVPDLNKISLKQLAEYLLERDI